MAKLFTTGTINQPDAGSVGLAMAERIRDDVVAHAAWELVEEFTPAAGAVRWYVFKCLGTSNGLGQDFYVVMGRTLSNGKLKMIFCDAYDAGIHQMGGYPVEQINNNLFDADGRHPSTFALSTTELSDTGQQNVPPSHNWAPSGTSTKWWIIVGEDFFAVSFNGPSNGYFHVGAYAYLGQLPNVLPLVIIGSSRDKGYIARNPAVANVNVSGTYWTAMRVDAGSGPQGQYGQTTMLGFAGYWEYNDKLQNNQRPVTELGITITNPGSNPNWATVIGQVLGKMKNIRWSGQPTPGGLAYGDAFALNGTLWVPFVPGDGRVWDTGVASS